MDPSSTDLYRELDWCIELAETTGKTLTTLEAMRIRRRLTAVTIDHHDPVPDPHPGMPPFMRALAVARWLRVDPGTVYDLLDAGEFPNAVRISDGARGIWSIPRSDVEAFIARNRVRPRA